MSYPGDQFVLPLPLRAPSVSMAGEKLAALYQVSARIYTNGHACTQLTHLDMGGYRIVTAELGCYQDARPSRTQAVALLCDAALNAWTAESAGVE